MTADILEKRYSEMLRGYLHGDSRENDVAADEIGEALLHEDISLPDLSRLHWRVLSGLNREVQEMESAEIISRANAPFSRIIEYYATHVHKQLNALRDAVEALRQDGAVQREIVEGVADGVVTFDLKGRVTSLNAAAARMFGYDKAELIGRALAGILKLDETEAAAGFWKAYDGNEVDGIPYGPYMATGHHKGGSSFSLEVTLRALHLEPVAAVAFIRLAKASMPGGRHDGKGDVAFLREMIAAVAHDLSQPLNVIRVTGDDILDLLREGEVAHEEVARRLDMVVRQVARTTAALDRLRELGGAQRAEDIRISMKSALMTVAALFERQFKSQSIALAIELPSQSRDVAGDQARFEELVAGLFILARDEIQAWRRRCPADDGERVIRIRLIDTPAAEVVHLTMHYHGNSALDSATGPVTVDQISEETSSSLRRIREIVQELGGALDVESGEERCIGVQLPIR